MKRPYTTKSYEVVEGNRMERSQALPGFPYISYKGAQAVEMAYCFKVLLRDNVLEALYRDNERRYKSYVDMTNKTLRDITAKGYLESHVIGSGFSYTYTLSDLGFEYLGLDKYPTDFSRADRIKFYAVNRVFSGICEQHRGNYTIDWEAGTEVGDAQSIIWKDVFKKEALECHVWKALETNFQSDQLQEILKIQKEFEGMEKVDGLPDTPDIYVVSRASEDFTLKVLENGKPCISQEEIEKWLMRQ